MPEVKESIKEKYNALLTEVALHYDFTNESFPTYQGWAYIKAFDWNRLDNETISENQRFLKKWHTYFIPFYKVFISVHAKSYQYAYLDGETFSEINDIVSAMRISKNIKEKGTQ